MSKKLEDSADEAAIVSLIYESIFTPRSWSGYVERDSTDGVGEEAEQSRLESSVERLPPRTLKSLVPYLEQALLLGGRTHEPGSASVAQPALLQELPLPVCVIADDLTVLSATAKAATILEHGSLLSRAGEKISASDEGLQKALANAVTAAIESAESQVFRGQAESGGEETFLTVPISWNSPQGAVRSAVLFLNLEQGAHDKLISSLQSVYELTPSEAEVTVLLAQGLSVEQIASNKSSSPNTVRTQLKSVFGKTQTSRQAELVSMVLSGPGTWLSLAGAADALPLEAQSDESHLLELDDGRMLSYGDYGPSDGTPVLMCHHLLGCRYERPEDPEVLRSLDIRLIVPERPGVGNSTAKERGSLFEWADDVRALVDHLEIERFYVIGFSSGGPHGAVCAITMSDRVIKLGLVASLMPVDELPDGISVSTTQRFVDGMARHWPSGLKRLLEMRYRRMLADPEASMTDFMEHGNGADAEMLSDPEMSRIRLRNLQVSSAVPREVFAQELILLSQPWGFSLADLEVPVLLWHGRQDDYFSADQAASVAAWLPQCRATISDDWGHFFIYQNWEAVLGELVS